MLFGDEARAFVLAGNSRFTIVSKKTGTRFTYRVEATDRKGIATHFVSVLTGPDNSSDYQYVGFITGGRFVRGAKSRIGATAPSVVAFAWTFSKLGTISSESPVELWHCGACGRCGRALTDPESLRVGIGPTCRGK